MKAFTFDGTWLTLRSDLSGTLFSLNINICELTFSKPLPENGKTQRKGGIFQDCETFQELSKEDMNQWSKHSDGSFWSDRGHHKATCASFRKAMHLIHDSSNLLKKAVSGFLLEENEAPNASIVLYVVLRKGVATERHEAIQAEVGNVEKEGRCFTEDLCVRRAWCFQYMPTLLVEVCLVRSWGLWLWQHKQIVQKMQHDYKIGVEEREVPSKVKNLFIFVSQKMHNLMLKAIILQNSSEKYWHSCVQFRNILTLNGKQRWIITASRRLSAIF